MTLSRAQLEAFGRDGFVQCGPALDDTRLAALQADIGRVVEELPPGTRPENMRNPHEKSRLFLSLCLDGPIPRAAESLLGPDLLMWGTYGFAKPPGHGLDVDWHQDGRYFPLTPMETVTAWLAIDDADLANGCLEMIPGSHRPRRFLPTVHHEDWGRKTALPIAVADVDATAAVPLEMAAGRFSLHDPYVIHGSGPNRSPRPRRGIQILYMTRRVRLDTDDEQAMGLDWETLRVFHCRPGARPAYHYAGAPGDVLEL